MFSSQPPGQPRHRPDPAGFATADLARFAFTADALHVHPGNLGAIFHRGGEYAITRKSNQPKPRDALAALFPVPPAGQDPPHHVTCDQGHSRIEPRSSWVTPDVAGVFQAPRMTLQRWLGQGASATHLD